MNDMRKINEIRKGSYVTFKDISINQGKKLKVLLLIEENYVFVKVNNKFLIERIDNLKFNGNEPQFSF